MENESEVLGYKVSGFFISLIRYFCYNQGTEIWWKGECPLPGPLIFLDLLADVCTNIHSELDFFIPAEGFSVPNPAFLLSPCNLTYQKFLAFTSPGKEHHKYIRNREQSFKH